MKISINHLITVILLFATAAAFSLPLPIEDAVSLAAADIDTALNEGTRVAVIGCRSSSENLSRFIVHEMVFSLVKSRKLVVVDREDMDLIRSELMLQLSGETSEASIQEIGAMLGAEVIISCAVDESSVLRTKAIAVATTRLLAVSSRQILEAGTYLTLTEDLNAVRTVQVSNVDELIAAIGPDRIIHLASGTYNLSDADTIQNRYVSWLNEYDGPCPVIKSVANLSFRGEDDTVIVTEPAYGWVFSFETCSGIRASNITFGHTTPGYCLGGVLRFNNCTDVEIRNCDLYGSGTIGVSLERMNNFVMDSSIIRECTSGLLQIQDSSNIQFSYTVFKDTGEYSLIEIAESDNIKWQYCDFLQNRGYTLFSTDYRSRNLSIEGGRIEYNDVKSFCNYPDRLNVNNTEFLGNEFDRQ